MRKRPGYLDGAMKEVAAKAAAAVREGVAASMRAAIRKPRASRALRLWHVNVRAPLRPGKDQVEVFRYVVMARGYAAAVSFVKEYNPAHDRPGMSWSARPLALPAVLVAAYCDKPMPSEKDPLL